MEIQEPQMTIDKSGNVDVISYNQKYYYRMGFSSTGPSWLVRNIGNNALIIVDDPETLVKLEKLYEDMILDTGGIEEPEENEWKNVALKFGRSRLVIIPHNYYELSPDEWFRWAVFSYNNYMEQRDKECVYTPKSQEEVEKLQEKEWTYKITDEHGEVNHYKQHLNPKKPTNLTDLIYDWWEDIFTSNSDLDMETSIDDLVDRIKRWLPKEQSAAGSQNTYVECTVEGFNDCLQKIKSLLR